MRAFGFIVVGLWAVATVGACVAAAQSPDVDPVVVSTIVGQETADAAAGGAVSLPPDRLVLALDIPPGSSFGAIMDRWGLPTYALRQAALPIYDLATIRATDELAVELVDGDPVPVAIRYAMDEDRTLVLDRTPDGWVPRVEDTVYTTHDVAMLLDIRSSLWEAGISAGLRPGDLTTLANVFAYEVDFNTEIRQGASLGLVGEMLSTEGRKDKLGALHAVRLVNGGKTYEMVRFDDDDGTETWYHPDGTSLAGSFLRSPLEFSRVTSGFNPRRFHPILKIARPHNGTDFGAPSGTPVRAVARGTVTFAGRNGGHGNFVKLRHDDGYETSYSHLSAILVRKGDHVSQGQTVGRVGATGLATGPHLHFQMWKNGRFVDPMKDVPPILRPLPAQDRPAFDALVQQWLPQVPRPPA